MIAPFEVNTDHAALQASCAFECILTRGPTRLRLQSSSVAIRITSRLWRFPQPLLGRALQCARPQSALGPRFPGRENQSPRNGNWTQPAPGIVSWLAHASVSPHDYRPELLAARDIAENADGYRGPVAHRSPHLLSVDVACVGPRWILACVERERSSRALPTALTTREIRDRRRGPVILPLSARRCWRCSAPRATGPSHR